jgi:hypothetical protein
MVEKEGEKNELSGIRSKIRGLHSRVVANDSGAIRVSAYLARQGGDLARERNDLDTAEEMYTYGAKSLERLKGDDYESTRDQRDLLWADARSITQERGMSKAKARQRVGVYTSSGEVRVESEKYHNVTAMILIWGMIAGAAYIISPVLTGDVVGATAQKISGVLGLCLFVLGLIMGYVYLLKRNN